MKILSCPSWTSQPGRSEDWGPLGWMGGSGWWRWGRGLNQYPAPGRREEDGPALGEPGQVKLLRVLESDG